MQVPPVEEGGALTPLAALGLCHECIARMLERLEVVTAEAAAAPPSDLPARAHALVADLDEAMGVHMVDEESEMFPAVLAAADSPARRGQAFALVSALLVEHREMAEQWHALRISLLALGGGIAIAFPTEAARDFIARLRVHLEREDFELSELLRALDPARAREIASAISLRHADACPRDGSCPRKG
jgi:hypothetical protein